MTWKFDPSISSADYLALARKRARYRECPKDLEWMLTSARFDFGVHREHVERLLDKESWSAAVLSEGRKPRVFIDAYVNQRGNVEIRSIGGQYRIYFEDDWSWYFLNDALRGQYGPHRSGGEIMWMRDFDLVSGMVIARRNPVAKALLFGFKQRLDELIREISEQIELIGAMPMELTYAGKSVSSVDFVPNITNDTIRALQRALFGWSFFDKPGDPVDLD